ncbi:hypothetical protein Psfp_02211 [Pelotomaculum sp. FP]|nr:hypothetical protein Psfp_02211 [Pelotomaculum sp. FP]
MGQPVIDSVPACQKPELLAHNLPGQTCVDVADQGGYPRLLGHKLTCKVLLARPIPASCNDYGHHFACKESLTQYQVSKKNRLPFQVSSVLVKECPTEGGQLVQPGVYQEATRLPAVSGAEKTGQIMGALFKKTKLIATVLLFNLKMDFIAVVPGMLHTHGLTNHYITQTPDTG